jgi:excisionase family DNA binding protein
MNGVQRHYRILEAAELLGISKWTVYRLVKEGRLTLVKVGKRASGIPADSLRNLMRGDAAKE